MKKLLIIASVFVLLPIGAWGAGFGLYEASARGNAMGGALVGSTRDASAVYYNPANMTEMTNMSVMVGGTMVGLYSDIHVDGREERRMDPGMFYIPNFYFTMPLPWDFSFGLGAYCENGLGTEYANDWTLAGDTISTTLEQFTFNAALAYEITDWWSVAAGLKMSYITFKNTKRPYYGMAYPFATGDGYMLIPNAYHLYSDLDGDDLSIGYNFGTTFTLLPQLKLGVVYRSQIKHDIEGDYDLSGHVAGVRQSQHGDASAKLTLPQSLTMGLNYDATDDLRFGTVLTWTEWSCVDTISFKIPATGGYDMPLKWKDVWRIGLGVEYDLMDSLSLRGGYAYDFDPSDDAYGTTMLPGGDRHILGLGVGWYVWSTLRIDIGYNLVFMCSGERDITVAGPVAAFDRTYRFENTHGFSHMLALSLSYEF